MEFPVMSRALSQARPGVHRFRGTATGGHGAHVPGLLPGAPLQALAAEARKVLPKRHLLERPSRTGFPACEPCHRSWNRTLVPSLPAVPSACPSQRLRAVTSGQRRLVEVGPYLAVQRRNRSGPPPRSAFQLAARRLLQSRCRRRNRRWTAQIPPGVPWNWPDPPHRPRRGGGPPWPGRQARRRGGWAAAGGGPVPPTGAGGLARPGTITGALARR
jgi:hypothetical protein